jgi:hypothetical protein
MSERECRQPLTLSLGLIQVALLSLWRFSLTLVIVDNIKKPRTAFVLSMENNKEQLALHNVETTM